MGGFGRNHPRCVVGCGAYARPNVHFFDPDTAYLECPEALAATAARSAWERRVASKLRANGNGGGGHEQRRLAILEIGCGTLVSTLRSRIDMLLSRCTPPTPVAATTSSAAPATTTAAPPPPPAARVVRINPSPDLLEYETTAERRNDTVHLLLGAREGIELLDKARAEIRRRRLPSSAQAKVDSSSSSSSASSASEEANVEGSAPPMKRPKNR